METIASTGFASASSVLSVWKSTAFSLIT